MVHFMLSFLQLAPKDLVFSKQRLCISFLTVCISSYDACGAGATGVHSGGVRSGTSGTVARDDGSKRALGFFL